MGRASRRRRHSAAAGGGVAVVDCSHVAVAGAVDDVVVEVDSCLPPYKATAAHLDMRSAHNHLAAADADFGVAAAD